jgi:hypothetical protein
MYSFMRVRRLACSRYFILCYSSARLSQAGPDGAAGLVLRRYGQFFNERKSGFANWWTLSGLNR